MSRALLVLLVLLVVSPVYGTTFLAWDYAYVENNSGTTYRGGVNPPPSHVDVSQYDTDTGLGTVLASFNNPGAYSILWYVNVDIDTLLNTSFNEAGDKSGTPAAGQTWQIGDFASFAAGNIWDQVFTTGSLTNTNDLLPPGPTDPDYAFALGHTFTLSADETAVVRFLISETNPGGFHLLQRDPDSNVSIYFSSSATVANSVVPEPGTYALVLGSLAGFMAFRRIRR